MVSQCIHIEYKVGGEIGPKRNRTGGIGLIISSPISPVEIGLGSYFSFDRSYFSLRTMSLQTGRQDGRGIIRDKRRGYDGCGQNHPSREDG
ncbi:hypothetical protein OUZ56_033190 [Daphnia magna]|uniref:Uncharacterized protein n=1 Tax=Daphnia magna TaxID=35525 RepID=A0ABQ9ZXN9_9CRUS|nr:hypothetical protein OUZ56_033190 [Daphnia magna]